MPPQVRAQVVDIRADKPAQTDCFFVDTNAWYWLSYPRASQTVVGPQSDKIKLYPAYIKLARSAKAPLHCCALTFAELAHNIEKAEWEIHAQQIGQKSDPKKFRHQYTGHRKQVVELIKDVWGEVLCMSTQLDITLNGAFTSSALATFPTVVLDGYDLLILEAMRQKGLTQIITDDSDYASVPGITIFTANQTVVRAAQKAGKLIAR
ncbi:hypothetical protein MTYM_00661 [Methylococcales bacterium]|nr:hypothetical protein MTYM_00661 [Methylococcales bacterium]